MKKVYFVLSIIFTILTFLGALYVILNNGKPNAGYAVIPMIFSLLFQLLYKNHKNEKDTKLK